MPNIITHVLFARELDEEYLDESIQALIHHNEPLYEIGANGPDFLYFHGVCPQHMKRKSQIRTLGKYCHRKNSNAFFKSLCNVIRQERDPELAKDEISYVLGLLTHWALDSVTHPYIFYRTGSGDAVSSYRHHRMESLLDAILLKVKKEETIRDFHAYKICEIDIDDVRSIARLYVAGARSAYDVSIKGHEILEALNDWAFIQKVLYDQKGAKLQACQKIEDLLHLNGLVSGMIVPNEASDPCDICNLLHDPWNHPCDPSKISTASFFDLYQEALLRAKEAIQLFVDCLYNVDKEIDFLNFIDNRNYTKGTPDNPPMISFDPELELHGRMLLEDQH